MFHSLIPMQILGALGEKKQITSKSFGKSVLYWINQDDMPEVDKEGMDKMEKQLEELKEQQKSLTEECKELKSEIHSLLSQPTNDKADELINSTLKEVR